MSRVVTDGDLSPQRHFPRNRGPAYVAAPRGVQYPEDLISPTNPGIAPGRPGDHVRRPAGRTAIRTVQEGHQLTEGDDFADNRGGSQRRITIPSGGGGGGGGGYHGNTSPLRNAIHGRSESHSGESAERGGRAEHAADLQPRRAASSNEAGYGRPAALRLDADMIKAGRKDALSPRRMVKVATPSSQSSSAMARPGGPGGAGGGGSMVGSFQASRGEAEHMRRVAELVEAVRANDVDLVNVVLQEAPSRTALLNTVHPASQRTALHEAVIASSTEAAGALLEWGADPDGGQSSQMPPIMHAVEKGNDKMVTLLLSHGADINAQDAKQCTALHYACAAGHRGIIKLLLVAGANMYARNRDNLYPQQLASTDRIRTLFRKLHEYHQRHGLVGEGEGGGGGAGGGAGGGGRGGMRGSPPISPGTSGRMSPRDVGGMVDDGWDDEVPNGSSVQQLISPRSLAARTRLGAGGAGAGAVQPGRQGPAGGRGAVGSRSAVERGSTREDDWLALPHARGGGGGGGGGGDGGEQGEVESPRDLLDSNEQIFLQAWENDRDDDSPAFAWPGGAGSGGGGGGGGGVVVDLRTSMWQGEEQQARWRQRGRRRRWRGGT
ncbi:hypothetical protein CLOP_g21639 [Closterium sp. NIES-67]|nr:hypothetical protein CLOP_g21639 [Closterium sp. NIES-67]